MLSSLKARAELSIVGFAFLVFTLSLTGPAPASAQEQYPSVARLSFVSGAVAYSRGDDPDEWDDAIENVPVTIGDRIYTSEDGRAEIQLSSGNFVRLAGYLSTLNLAEDVKQFYLGAGAAAFTIRRLQTDEVIEIDTPNVAVTLDEPGNYRIAVDENGDSRITVRRGRATVAAHGRQVAVKNSEIRVYGIDSPRYEIVALPAKDAFDRWVIERDDRFARASADAYRYASEDIVGGEDLAEYGRWENIPEYGYAWTPSVVAAGWTPFSDGHWYWQDPWGWTWISKQRWGWATSHYGRWTPYRSRWYWVPVRPRNRVKYAPACVEFVRIRDHVGWFPLHPRDRQIPRWKRRDRQRFDRNVIYMNRTYVTIVDRTTFASARPVHRHIVRDPVVLREFTSARLITESLPVPNRSSLRLVGEDGGQRNGRPSATVVNRVPVVRTAPPAPPRTFQEKLPEIQKNQGKPVEPARLISTAQDDRVRAQRVRIRASADADRGIFAPLNPGVSSVAAQPLTEARGKRLATRDNPVRPAEERAPATAAPPQSAQSPQSSPAQGNGGKTSASRADRDRERQQLERERQNRQQELERRQQEQKEAERKVQAQKQQEERRARQSDDQRPEASKSAPAASFPAQQRLEELERRQAQQEEEQARQRQEQEHRQQLRQQQLQERQAQQQKHQELQRRQQQQQQEQERRLQMQQQEQTRREQLRQQQLQEIQVREQQRRQLERRQQQIQERRIQQLQRQQEQERRQQFRQQQPQERQQPSRQPGQF